MRAQVQKQDELRSQAEILNRRESKSQAQVAWEKRLIKLKSLAANGNEIRKNERKCEEIEFCARSESEGN